MKTTCLFLLGLAFCWGLFSCTAQQPKPEEVIEIINRVNNYCLLYTSPSPRDKRQSRMPSSA